MASIQVLHVEDQDDIRDIVTISLGVDPDIALATAASGLEALDLLSGGLRPDVILLDVMMPEIDGIETLSRLRGLPGHAETPVIFMTARTMDHERTLYMELGALGVIAKPFDPMTLAKSVREFLMEFAA
ncbi:MAG TPA: response regulator [Methyloceanibacter sp.]|nr:response regulator [Methyloceanibacter sp.]